MAYMRVLFQECKPGTVDELCRDVEETLVPRLRGIPGFRSYRIGKIDDRNLVAVGLLDTRAAALELDRLGAEWRNQYGQERIVSVRRSIGQVLVDSDIGGAEEHPVI